MSTRPRVALATSDGIAHDGEDRGVVDALARREVHAVEVPWNDAAADWSEHDLVVVRSTWDYTTNLDAFLAWVDTVADASQLWNPADVIHWNTHKSYLLDLEERGAPVIPTAWCHQGQRVDLAALLATRGWSSAVIKPAVGASAEGLLAVEPHLVELAQHHLDSLLARGDAMVQPLQPVATLGETSLVFIDGDYSHAVNKRPARGAVTTQSELGGSWQRIEPEPETVALGAWVLDILGRELLYARVDLLPDDSGTPQLVELEVTEPSLFLAADPRAADRLAEGIVRLLEDA